MPLKRRSGKQTSAAANRDKQTTFTVPGQDQLLSFLLTRLAGQSRGKVKSLLAHRQVTVAGVVITQFDQRLEKGQRVVINRHKTTPPNEYAGLKILFEDDSLIVIEKEAGLLSVSTDREKEKTAFRILNGHVKSQNAKNRVFTVHRLDKGTSGVMMFAKCAAVRDKLQHTWEESVTERVYALVVEGMMPREEDTLTSWLKENKIHKMYSSRIPTGGQKAVTHYRVVKKSERYSLLEVRLETGRKNQIRVQLKDIGHPVVGDEKYGSTVNPLRRLALHAGILGFYHPKTGEKLRFASPVPRQFHQLVRQQDSRLLPKRPV